MVMAIEDALEELEHLLDVGAAAVDDGEGVEMEGGGHLAAGVALGARGADDDGRNSEPPRCCRALEHVEDTGAGVVAGGGGAEVHGEAEVDDGDVDRGGADDLLGLAGGADAEGLDAHGSEEAGHAVGPGVGPPAAPAEEEVEAVVGMGGDLGHGEIDGGCARPEASCVPVVRGRGRGVVRGVAGRERGWRCVIRGVCCQRDRGKG